jgi:hypothetical protein
MRSSTIVSALLLTLVVQTCARAADFSGTFADPQIKLELKLDNGIYPGTLAIKDKPYPATASEQNGQLVGKFDVNGTKFDFTAVPEGQDLKLSSGGRTYVLARQGGAAPAPINPITGLPDAPNPQPNTANQGPSANVPPNTSNTPQGPATPVPAPQPPSQATNNQPEGPAAPTLDQVTTALKSIPAGEARPNREWTILVYLDADNDLEPFGMQDLNEMEKGLSDPNIEVIVLVDRCKGFDKTEGDWTGARVYRIQPDTRMDQLASQQLLDLGEVNMGEPKVLAAFMEGAYKAYPARQRALVMWDHGGGWASMANDFDAPGGTDNRDDLKLTELREGVEAGLKGAGLKKLQILGFDMCLMAQIETATEMADCADVMVASQAVEPGFGWPYDVVLPAFAKGTGGPRRIGTDIVTAFNDFYRSVKKEDVATLAALDLSLTEEFNKKFNAVIEKYSPTMDKNWTTLARAIFYGEQYCDRGDFKRGKHALASFDVMDMVKRLKFASEGFPAEEEYRAFMDTADKFVLMSANSDRHKLSNGVAVYAPVHAKMLNESYTSLKFAKASKWPALVAAMHADQAKETSAPVFANIRMSDINDKPIEAFKPLAGHRYHFTLTGKNIITTQAWSGERNEQLKGVVVQTKGFVIDPEWILRYKEQVAHAVDMIMPKYKDGVNELKDDFPGLGLIVSNGKETSTLTLDGTDLDSTDSWSAEALIEHPSLGDKPVQATIIFSNYTFDATGIVARMPQPDGSVRLRAVEPQADLKVSMIHDVVNDAGEVKLHTFKTFTWNDGLSLIVVAMKPGNYESILVAETMSGVTGQARAQYKVEADQDLVNAAQGWQHFKPEMLTGAWEAFIRNGQEQKLHMTLTIKATDKPYLYMAEATQLDGSKSKMLIDLDLRGLPNMRMIELGPDGKFVGVILAPALFDVDQQSRPFLLVKYVNLSGVNAIWKRKEAADINLTGAGDNEERLKPVPVPDPIPLQMQNQNQNQPPNMNGGF